MKKNTWVFVFLKYGKYWSILIGHFMNHKSLISEEWHFCYHFSIDIIECVKKNLAESTFFWTDSKRYFFLIRSILHFLLSLFSIDVIECVWKNLAMSIGIVQIPDWTVIQRDFVQVKWPNLILTLFGKQNGKTCFFQI